MCTIPKKISFFDMSFKKGDTSGRKKKIITCSKRQGKQTEIEKIVELFELFCPRYAVKLTYQLRIKTAEKRLFTHIRCGKYIDFLSTYILFTHFSIEILW